MLRDKPVEQHPEHVTLKVPPINTAAKIVGNTPNCLVKLGALSFLAGWGHTSLILRDSGLAVSTTTASTVAATSDICSLHRRTLPHLETLHWSNMNYDLRILWL